MEHLFILLVLFDRTIMLTQETSDSLWSMIAKEEIGVGGPNQPRMKDKVDWRMTFLHFGFTFRDFIKLLDPRS